MAATKRKFEGETPEGANKRSTPRSLPDQLEGCKMDDKIKDEKAADDHMPVDQTTTAQATTAPKPDAKPFRLLDLPPELRNNIYEKVLEDVHPIANLSRFPRKSRNLTTHCRLLAVSKQVSEEFRDILVLHVPIIQTPVRNFHFSHVMTFLNRLADSDLNMLASDEKRVVRIERCFDDDWVDFGGEDQEQMMLWLNRMGSKKKKGTNVEFEYVLKEGTEGEAWVFGFNQLGAKGMTEFRKIKVAGGGRFDRY